MSKGSLFWGKGTGKLGEIVLSQLKGVQVARAYQPNVTNPRTTAQTDQRILFSCAVKFYKHAVQNMFKFAYEDKRKNESYYNAFMRKNAKLSMVTTREQYLNVNYPALGSGYLMADGSLPELSLTFDNSVKKFKLSLGAASAAIQEMTIADVSKALISQYNLQEGDIITFVYIATNLASLEAVPTAGNTWKLGQFIINTSDTSDFAATLESQGFSGINLAAKATTAEGAYIQYALNTSSALGSCVIASRQLAGQQLLVSPAHLINNTAADSIIEASLDASFRNKALNSWGRTSSAILQGSIAKNV